MNIINKVIEINTIGIVHSCFTTKFGIPRQANLVPAARGQVEMLPPYNDPEAFKRLEEFSHLWLTFYMHQAARRGWRPTVRPPRLGGNRRVGVFASRSPQRPNFLGLSLVKLDKITAKNNNVILDISGVDMVDKTPIVDIKPYLPYSDKVEASDGYAPPPPRFKVVFSQRANLFCSRYKKEKDRNIEELIRQLLELDPRPAYHGSEKRGYGLKLWDLEVKFSWNDGFFLVEDVIAEG